MDLGIDGAALIREAHGTMEEGESLQDSLRRVIAHKYPGHQEEVLRATRLLMDMMTLMERGGARRAQRAVLDGKYRLDAVLTVTEGSRGRISRAPGHHGAPCPRCGGEVLLEFNHCLTCGSLWPARKQPWWHRRRH